jgi:triacylglycerol lipase
MGSVGRMLANVQRSTMAAVVGRADDGARLAARLDDLGPIGRSARPVVIQGGYSTDAYMYEPLREVLRRRGFTDVTATKLSWHGFAPIQDDAARLLEQVRAASRRSLDAGGDGKVTVIAHSKGGLAARWMLQKLGGIEQVAQLGTLGTPHHGFAPLGTNAARITALMPAPKASRQLLGGSRLVRALDQDLGAFMLRARAVNPQFRIVSIAGDIGGALRGTDGLVSNAAARLDDRIAGVHNLVFRGSGANHLALAAQTSGFEPALRSATLLAAGRDVADAALGAAVR